MFTHPVVAVRSQLDDLAGAWDELVDASAVPSPFLRSWWLAATAETQITVLTVLDGERLVGGAAFGRGRRLGVDRFTAPGPPVLCPDHLDLLAAPGHADVVAAAVGAWFAAQRPWVVDLRGVVDDPLLARALGRAAAPDDVAPWQPLGPGEWLPTRSSSVRRGVRRAARKLEARGLTHRRVSGAEVPAALAAFRSLHADREGRGALLAEMERLSAAVTRGVGSGEARVDVLASAEEVAAVSVAFVVAGRLSLYQVARSQEREHDGAGTVLLAAVIEDAAATGCREVDLLRGDESYKRSFGDHARTLGRLRAAGGWRGRALLAAEDAARAVRAALLSARRSAPAGSGAWRRRTPA